MQGARMNPLELIDFIVWYATTRGEVLTPIRLVKFLYLLDLYHARQTNGRTLTGWPWAFVHYGPFCGEALEAIETAAQRGIVEARPYQSRYDGEQHFVYRSPHTERERPRASETLPLAVAMALEAAIRRWGGDTAALLDHVYFETEPMLTAAPGQRLDFSTAQQPPRAEPVPMLRLRSERIAEGRRLLARLRARAEQGLARTLQEAQAEIRDQAYRAFLEQLEPPDQLPNVEGTATLTPSDPPPPGDQQ